MVPFIRKLPHSQVYGLSENGSALPPRWGKGISHALYLQGVRSAHPPTRKITMGKSVTIEAMDDGRFCVSPEAEGSGMPVAGEQEAPEAGPEGSTADMQQDAKEGEPENYCDSLDEALDMAAQMLSAAAPGAEGGKPMMEGEADFLAGFKEAGGTPL